MPKGVRLCQPLNLGLPAGDVCPRICEALRSLDARGDARRTGERWLLSVRFPMIRRDTEQIGGSGLSDYRSLLLLESVDGPNSTH